MLTQLVLPLTEGKKRLSSAGHAQTLSSSYFSSAYLQKRPIASHSFWPVRPLLRLLLEINTCAGVAVVVGRVPPAGGSSMKSGVEGRRGSQMETNAESDTRHTCKHGGKGSCFSGFLESRAGLTGRLGRGRGFTATIHRGLHSGGADTEAFNTGRATDTGVKGS